MLGEEPSMLSQLLQSSQLLPPDLVALAQKETIESADVIAFFRGVIEYFRIHEPSPDHLNIVTLLVLIIPAGNDATVITSDMKLIYAYFSSHIRSSFEETNQNIYPSDFANDNLTGMNELIKEYVQRIRERRDTVELQQLNDFIQLYNDEFIDNYVFNKYPNHPWANSHEKAYL